MKYLLILLSGVLYFPGELQSQKQVLTKGMNNEIMERIIKSKTDYVEGEAGNWQLIYEERLVIILTDETNNRMRIFTPFAESDSISKEEMHLLLTANFHSALDVKYCFYEGLVMSVFTHPLRELTREQFEDALLQVVTLADNYGSTYSSTDLIFSPHNFETEEDAKEKEKEENEKKVNQKPGKARS